MMWGFNSICGGYGSGALGFTGWIFMILWWAFIIIGVATLLKWLTGYRGWRSRGEQKSPLDILEERYAKGEINKEEFDAKRKDLMM